MSCRVLRILNTIWYTTSKIKTRGEDASQEFSVKDVKRDKGSVSTGVLFLYKDPFCFIEGPYVFTRSRRKMRYMGAK